MQPLSLQQVADRAGVGQEFVRRLIELGALGRDENGYGERDVHLVALLHVWESAGLSAESILAAVEAGELSLEFLETPAWRLPEPLALTYYDLTATRVN
jgi:hypothetical protein